ncbi:MAG: hypothetical protein COX65_03165 [Elusimicrobia bacterium CG_4_10_14_0_2_um_filter_56_8]|nr:MAG: hypothetical protein AUJ51_02460 [Elusimicrobia bacterium CG1_02_56_21]PJA16196.1 MAG: hypothetical protein COX65_03165 [Elusimicrobia bacterium CG_4_10_14_0_2_um_filter_56_8]
MSRLTQALKGLAELLPAPHFTGLELGTLYFLHFSAFLILASVIYKFRAKSENERKGLLPEKKRGHFVATLTMSAGVLLMFIFINHRALPFDPGIRLKWFCYAFGMALVISGLFWHLWSKVSIGKFWSDQPEIQKEHIIVTSGAYSFARHPMYGSLILWCLGLGLASFNLAALLATGLVFIPMMIIRAKAEEAMLSARPGYDTYRNNVRMFFPSLSGGAGFAAKTAALAAFIYSAASGITAGSLVFLLTLHLLLGYSLKPEKTAFSYRSKAFMMALTFILCARWRVFYFLYYLIAAMFAYGLFFDCPCMIVYEKYHRCPCFDLLGKACRIDKQ